MLAGGTAGTAGAQSLTPAAALARVLAAPTQKPDWYATAVLSQISMKQMDGLVAGIDAQLGTFQKVTGDGAGGDYVAIYSGGTLPCWIALDADGKIAGIFFKSPQPTMTSLNDALAKFAGLHGTLSYLVLQNGKVRAAVGQQTALAVGSTFKLAVLTALDREIRSGKRHWSDVVLLRDGWRSMPSGVMQAWPAGTPVTLATLAAEMISISDNTATDTLIHTLGRAAIEPYAGANVPLLTTRAMFALKTKNGGALRAAWRAGDATARRALIARLEAAPLDENALALAPADADIEWHFTNRRLCALMAGVRDLPLFTINPGVANASDWKHVAFKGGSDSGVISMTTWLTAKNGTQFCVSATLDDRTAEVDEKGFSMAYAAVIQRLRDEAQAH